MINQFLLSFFTMDDFYFLQISQADSLREFISLFKPIANIPYRPISQQLFFFSLQKLFGLNPLPFHFFIFLIHFINTYLVYKLTLNFLKKRIKASFIGLIYFFSSLHFVGLYSITGSYIIFGVFYFLLSFLFWFKFEKDKRKIFYLLSLLFFILGIFSAEIGFSLPFLIILFSKKNNRKLEKVIYKIKEVIPYGLVIIFNLWINHIFAGAPETKAFSFNFSSFPSVFRWYILRGLGLPEGVKNGYLWEKKIIYTLFFLLLAIIVFGFYRFCQKRNLKKEWSLIIKYLFWILIAALPFYFMAYHLNPIYFIISFIGLLLLLAKILNRKLFLIYTLLFIICSLFSTRLLLHTHWLVRRANLAKEWITQVKKNCFRYNKDNKVEILVAEESLVEELKIILQKDRALQLFCGNKNLEVIYKVESEK